MEVTAVNSGVKLNMKKLTILGLEGVFFLTVVVVAVVKGSPIPPVWMLPLLILATMRTAHTISYNEVMEWLREPFCYVAKDSCGAGDNVHARTDRGGFVEAIGGLLSCPSACSPTWAALGLYTLWAFRPDVGTAVIIVLALAGGSEFMHYVTQFFEWGARKSRVDAGKIAPDKDD